MSFTESNTVEQMILNAATGLDGKSMVIRKDARTLQQRVALRRTAPGALNLCLLQSGSASAYLSQTRVRAMFNKG